MPIEKNQVSFSGGEIAPALYAHTDLTKYATGLRQILNFFVHIQGGVSNRAGFEYLNCLKDQGKRPRLIPFQFSTTQNYILEFTENLMRVFKDGGLVLEPAKTITGITGADPGVVTSASHGFSNGEWVFIESVVGMTEVNNKFYAVANVTTNTFELQDVDGNDVDTSGFTAYSSAGTASRIFELAHSYAEDDLRLIKYTQSADVMSLCHTSFVQAELSRTSHYAWTLADIDFQPQIAWPTSLAATATTAGAETYKYKVTAVAEDTAEESLVGTQATKAITGVTKANPAVVTSNSHGYSNGDEVYIASVGGMTEINGKRFTVAGVTTNTFQLEDEDSTAYTTYTSGGTAARTNVTLTSAKLTTTDTITITWAAVAGAESYDIYKEDNGLYGYIGSTEELTFLDDNIAPALDDTPPKGRDPFANGNYPGAVTYHKQRRVFGGSNQKPQTINGTQTGNYKNMNVSSPLRDDDAFTFTLDSEQVQQIRHLTSLKKLIAFTSGSTWLVKGGNDSEIITPTSVDADEEFVSGCSEVRPLRIGRDILYVEDGGKDVLYLNYSLEADGLDGESLTLVSNHLFKRREIVEWCYTAKPYGIIWAVTDTGEMLGMTYNRKQQIWAWHRHETQGFFETIATIREGNEDVLYAGIRRTINGVTKRYIERMHSRNFRLVEDSFFVDAGVTLDRWNTNAASMAKVSGGTDYTTDETLTFTENATLSPFVAGDVGRGLALRIKNSAGDITARCQFTITGYNSATSVDVEPNTVVPEALQDVYTAEWSFTFSNLTGLEHLEGETVSILADGNVEPQQVVTGGTLPQAFSTSSKVHLGLPYNSDLETLDVDFTLNKMDTKTKLKGISEVTAIVEESRGLFAGPDADNLEEFAQREDENYNEPTELLTGRMALAIPATWSEGGRVFVRQSDPLPLTILAIIPEVEISD